MDYFCPFTLQQPKKSKFQIKEKKTWRCHHFTHAYQNLWLDDVRFLRYGVRQMDGWKKWHAEVGCWLSQISVKYLGVKIYTNLFCEIMLMVSPLNWIEPILYSSKEGNVLIKIHLQNMFISFYLFIYLLIPAHLAVFLFGLRISALINELGIFIPLPYSRNDLS